MVKGIALALGVSVALAGCGGGPAAQPKACKVERLAIKDMDGGAVNGKAMGTYGQALADSGATGVIEAPVRQAVRDAGSAQQDADAGNGTQYTADAKAFLADLEIIRGDCLQSDQ
jgi:hypothetical protein